MRVGWVEREGPLPIGRPGVRAEVGLTSPPAAGAAIDMALWDLFGQIVDASVVDLLGRCHDRLPTSITIGIKSTEEALEVINGEDFCSGRDTDPSDDWRVSDWRDDSDAGLAQARVARPANAKRTSASSKRRGSKPVSAPRASRSRSARRF